MQVFRFIVLDEFGEPLRRFATRREAKWFMENRPEFKLDIIPQKKEVVDMVKLYGECLF
jgi:hypothetical protein